MQLRFCSYKIKFVPLPTVRSVRTGGGRLRQPLAASPLAHPPPFFFLIPILLWHNQKLEVPLAISASQLVA